MKYLLLGSLTLLLSISSTMANDDDVIFAGVSFNEDVTRKFNLDLQSNIIEVTSDIRFKPWSKEDSAAYYYAISDTNNENLVSIKAVSASTQAPL